MPPAKCSRSPPSPPPPHTHPSLTGSFCGGESYSPSMAAGGLHTLPERQFVQTTCLCGFPRISMSFPWISELVSGRQRFDFGGSPGFKSSSAFTSRRKSGKSRNSPNLSLTPPYEGGRQVGVAPAPCLACSPPLSLLLLGNRTRRLIWLKTPSLHSGGFLFSEKQKQNTKDPMVLGTIGVRSCCSLIF